MHDILEQTGEGGCVDAASSGRNLPFIKLENVSTNAATPAEVSIENIKRNLTLNLPRLHHLLEFKVVKGFENKIALVGGGSSLRDTIHELKDFDVIIACGSVHDYLIDNNVIPTYCTVCDPDEVMCEYLKKHQSSVKYLIASNSHENVLNLLKEREIYLWHCYSDGTWGEFCDLDPEAQGVGGGCTVGLRSISIAIMLGYSNIHLFGFDSCLNDEEHHAYKFATDKEEIGTIYQLKIGLDTPGNKVYNCAGYQLAQAYQFKQFYVDYGNLFHPTFHGSGLLKDLFDWCMLNSKILQDTKPIVEAGHGIYTV